MIYWLATLTGIWVLVSAFLLIHLRNVRSLAPLQATNPDHPSGPRITAVFAARDEAPRVVQTVRRLLEQSESIARVVAVDDRSQDGTGELLEALAQSEPRLRVVRVAELPAGWLGKSHALHVGAQQVETEWILFTDADVWLEPHTATRALQAAERDDAQHVCLFPSTASLKERSIVGDGFVLGFGITLIDIFSQVNTDSPYGFAGVGAFNLVRTDLYRSFGGHQQLALEIADDPMLGVLVRRAGGRIRAYLAAESVECDWASGPRTLIRRLEKNHFAMLRFRVEIVLAAIAFGAVFWGGAVLAPVYAGPYGWLPVAGLLTTILPAALLARQIGMSAWSALLTPFALALMGVSLLNSTWTTLRQGGVRWRETFYPLAMLRKGCLDWRPRQRLTPMVAADSPRNEPA